MQFNYLKKTKSMGYDAVRSYEELISSKTISLPAQEDVDTLVAKKSTCGIVLLSVFDSAFVIGKGKG